MTVSILDYRDTTGFFGIRIYVSRKPEKKPIQEYITFKKSTGKWYGKAKQKALLKQAKARHAEILATNKIDLRRLTLKKNYIKNRVVTQPCRLVGVNIQINKPTRPNDCIEWEKRGGNIVFLTYPPVLMFDVGIAELRTRHIFRNKKQFFEGYRQAVQDFCDHHHLSDEQKAYVYRQRPTWSDVEKFVIADYERIYGESPFKQQ